jgi:hypothetical protein
MGDLVPNVNLAVLDLDGDGQDDLLAHDVATGWVSRYYVRGPRGLPVRLGTERFTAPNLHLGAVIEPGGARHGSSSGSLHHVAPVVGRPGAGRFLRELGHPGDGGNTMRGELVVMLRWVGVLPAAVIAGCLGYFVSGLGWVPLVGWEMPETASFWFLDWFAPQVSHLIAGPLMAVCLHLIFALAFVAGGVWIAPAYERVVGWTLSAILLGLVGVGVWVVIRLGLKDPVWLEPAQLIGVAIGAVYASWAGKRERTGP